MKRRTQLRSRSSADVDPRCPQCGQVGTAGQLLAPGPIGFFEAREPPAGSTPPSMHFPVRAIPAVRRLSWNAVACAACGLIWFPFRSREPARGKAP